MVDSIGLSSSHAKTSAPRSAGVRRALIGSLALAACVGLAGTATADTYRHHHKHVAQRAPVPSYDAYVGAGIAPSGRVMGSWRYKLLRGRCDSSYPMHEESPCGTATGGPVGGMGS